jgi:hypothetical protein
MRRRAPTKLRESRRAKPTTAAPVIEAREIVGLEIEVLEIADQVKEVQVIEFPRAVDRGNVQAVREIEVPATGVPALVAEGTRAGRVA